ncbi:MAG: hypothetical protein P4M15_12780 [Alphaproteobacteria bacterium]|nr:hypothetical protein [Alphaproteobacteria bacterium]
MNISRQELLACGNGLYASFGAASFDSLLNALTMLGGRFDSIKVAVPTGGKDGHRDIYTLNEYIESHMPSADALVAPPRPEPTPDWRKSLTAQPA